MKDSAAGSQRVRWTAGIGTPAVPVVLGMNGAAVAALIWTWTFLGLYRRCYNDSGVTFCAYSMYGVYEALSIVPIDEVCAGVYALFVPARLLAGCGSCRVAIITKEGLDMTTTLDIAEQTAASAASVRRFIRKHEIPMHKVFGKRERYVEVEVYIAKLRAEGYGEEANRLASWLQRHRLAGDAAN